MTIQAISTTTPAVSTTIPAVSTTTRAAAGPQLEGGAKRFPFKMFRVRLPTFNTPLDVDLRMWR